jgi:O-antigen ligase/tetratricopeptide (TPR) repeat protein
VSLAARALPLLGAAAALTLCADGASQLWEPAGLSNFGRPPWLAVAWALSGLATAATVLLRRDRLENARCLTALLLAATLFGGEALPATPGALLLLTGATLAVAAPWIRPGPSGLATLVALGLALPACLGSDHPVGALHWAADVLPPASLVLLLPAGFSGSRAPQAALLVLGATAALLVASLVDYGRLMAVLDLGLADAAVTRMRPLGLHPNLAVPSVTTALVLGASLVWSGTRRGLALVLLAPVLVAVAAMQSKTGTLLAVGGTGLALALRVRWPFPAVVARVLAVAIPVAVLAALLLPATGLTDRTITRQSASMVSKAVSFRSAMWQLGRDAYASAPLVGNGPRTTYLQGEVARPGRYDGLPKDDHPHNVVLAVGASLGAPGLAGLALLLLASLRRGRDGRALADAACVAAAVHWIADGVDMGGAVATLYPSGVLLLIGLSAAARRADEPAPGRGLATGAAGGLGLLLVVVGAGLAVQERSVRDADALLVSPAPDAALAQEAIAVPIDRAAWLLPADPRPWGQRAALAARAGDPAGRLEALEQALIRAPDRSGVVHAVALALSHADPDGARGRELLARALALDPYGPQAWSRHVDAAHLAGHRDDESAALEHLVTAVILNPEAVTRAGWIAARRALRLSVDGRRAVEIPLQRLFSELTRRRDDLAGVDPAYDARLRLREVEVLLALDLLDEADAACRELLADNPGYLNARLAQSAMKRGDPEGAIAFWTASGAVPGFEPLTFRLGASAQVSDPAGATFDQELEEALALLPDVGFEAASLRRLVDARRVMAERRGQPDEAARWEAALAWLDG